MDLQGRTPGGSSGASGRSLAALSQLCELVRRFNHRSFDAVVAFDWNGHSRCVECGLDDLDPTAHELVRQKCRLFLELAVGELEPLHPTPVGDVSPITILRRHVLEGDTWDVILAERKEQDQPRLSERTLKNRQREGCRLVMDWAARKPTGEEQQLDLPFSRRRERILLTTRWVGAAILAVLVLGGLLQLRPAPVENASTTVERRLRAVSPKFLGVELKFQGSTDQYSPAFSEVLADFVLPAIPSNPHLGMLVPRSGGKAPCLLLVTNSGGEDGGTAYLWDPVDNRHLWTLHWEPPPELIRTHETLTEPIHEEDWGIRAIGHAEDVNGRGSQIVLLHQQRYSPNFVLFVDKNTGQPIRYYAHPGHLSRPFMADLNRDGRPEVLMTGTDNVENRPVLVVLDPSDPENAAASTVMWNEEGEGAIFRVLLPAVPELERFHGYYRQHLRPITQLDWLPERRSLVVHVYMGQVNASTYTCYLRDGWQPLEEHSIVLDDRAQAAYWTPAGLDFKDFQEQLIENIELIPGRGFEEFVDSGRDDGRQ